MNGSMTACTAPKLALCVDFRTLVTPADTMHACNSCPEVGEKVVTLWRPNKHLMQVPEGEHPWGDEPTYGAGGVWAPRCHPLQPQRPRLEALGLPREDAGVDPGAVACCRGKEAHGVKTC